MVYGFTSKSLIRFLLILLSDKSKCFCKWIFSFPSTICWIDCLFCIEYSWLFCQMLVDCIFMNLFLDSQFFYISLYACFFTAAAKSLQSCPTLCDPVDSSPPGFPVPGILQARTLEWVAISFSNAWKVKVKSLSHVRLYGTPWTAPYQASPSMGFSRQEYWSGV